MPLIPEGLTEKELIAFFGNIKKRVNLAAKKIGLKEFDIYNQTEADYSEEGLQKIKLVCEKNTISFEKILNSVIQQFKKVLEDDRVQTSFMVCDDLIIEEVYDNNLPLFCIYNSTDKTITYQAHFIYNGKTYVPIADEEVTKEVIKLPTKPEEYGTDEELDNQIKSFITKWLDIPEDVLQFALWNIKRSWVYERFHSLNYLRALGDFGTGKSRFLDTLGFIHYKPIATSGATTPAPIFRIIEKWKGTLIMDEADLKYSDETADIIKIINLGYERGRPIMRCDQNNASSINFFDPFCPKILATRKAFEDRATESRCITHITQGTMRKNIPPNLNDTFNSEAMNIRNKLLMWRFRNYLTINPEVMPELGLDLEPRVLQIVSSFISLFAGDLKQFDNFKAFIQKHQESLIDERRDSFEGVIISAIKDLTDEGEFDIDSLDIINKANLTDKKNQPMKPRYLTKTLRALGFGRTELKRIGEKVKRCIPLEAEMLAELFKKYGLISCNNVTQVTLYLRTRDKKNNIQQTIQVEEVAENRNDTPPSPLSVLQTLHCYENFEPKALIWQPCAFPTGQDGMCGDTPCNEFNGLTYCEKHWKEAQR